MVLDFLAVDNFDFTRKIVKKNLGEKLVKMSGRLSKLNFWTKFDFSNSLKKGILEINLDIEINFNLKNRLRRSQSEISCAYRI